MRTRWRGVVGAFGRLAALVVREGVLRGEPSVGTGYEDSASVEFEAFFQQHERDIFGYLWRLTGEEQAAYDLSQETFLRAWQRFGKVRAYQRPGGWLFRVATNLALNHLRDRKTRGATLTPLQSAYVDGTGDPAPLLAQGDLVRRTLMALPPKQRAALVLREVYGMSNDEVAQAFGSSGGAAKTLLWRGRERFRELYRREEAGR